MNRQGMLLILALTIYHTWLFRTVEGNNGKLFGEECMQYNDCGESPKSFIACLDNICQCYDIQYYEQQRSMCVSYVGYKCDATEPLDGLPELKCGENAECRPKLRERFGICHCKHGYRESFDRKCVYDDSINTVISSAKYKHGKGDANGHTQLTHGASKSQAGQSNERFPFSGSYNFKSRSQSQLVFTVIISFLSFICSKFIVT